MRQSAVGHRRRLAASRRMVGKMRFARAGGAVEDHITAQIGKAALGQVDQTFFVDLGDSGEVEVANFLDHRELRLLKTSGNAPGFAPLHLQFRQLL